MHTLSYSLPCETEACALSVLMLMQSLSYFALAYAQDEQRSDT